MPKEELEKEGIIYPIKLEYYKIEERCNNYESVYGIEIMKTEYIDNIGRTENEIIKKITTNEKTVDEILKILKKNEVTPVTLKEILEDLYYI